MHVRKPDATEHVNTWRKKKLIMLLFLLYLISVGKTSLITRFMYDSFDNTYQVSTHVYRVQFNFVFR